MTRQRLRALRASLALAMLMAGLGACRAPAGDPAALQVTRVAEGGAGRPVAASPVLRPVARASVAPIDRSALYTGAFLVRLGAGLKPEALLARPALAGSQLRGAVAMGTGTLVRLQPPAAAGAAAWRNALAAEPGVLGVTPEARRQRFQAPTRDPRVAEQWAHVGGFTDTPAAWSLVPPAEQGRIVVAVLDSGLDVGHEEFAGRIVGARDATAGAADPGVVTDAEGHGTHVTGIIAADGGNGVGVAGVAWGVKVLPVKVFPDRGAGSDFDILSGFLYALQWRPSPDDGSRVRVVNMSLGSATGDVSAVWTEAFAMAREAGVIVCVAAGNEALPFVASPANCPGAIAVGSSNRYLGWEGLSPFSNGGERLDLVAPGEDILSTLPRGGSALGAEYGLSSGTSMATPYVAGVAALLCARYDRMNRRLDANFHDLAVARLKAATVDLGQPGRDDSFGLGRLDPKRALMPTGIEGPP